MITEKEVREMPLNQKLMLMETIWDDISRHEADFHSPAWHEDALRETEERLQNGLEEPMDWEIAKKKLRNREDGL